jgi:hypothetical protein
MKGFIATAILGAVCFVPMGVSAQEATITPYQDCMNILQSECNGDAQCVERRQPDCQGYKDSEMGTGGSGNPPPVYYDNGGDPKDFNCSARSRICPH